MNVNELIYYSQKAGRREREKRRNQAKCTKWQMRIWVTGLGVGSLPCESSEQKKHGPKAELEEEDRDRPGGSHCCTTVDQPAADRPWSPCQAHSFVTAALPFQESSFWSSGVEGAVRETGLGELGTMLPQVFWGPFSSDLERLLSSP